MNLLEIHILQNVAPACLNRDDTGSPKDALFGGVRRARLSSQSQKRAVRLFFREILVPRGLFSREDLALRTKRLVEELVRRLTGLERDSTQVEAVVKAVLGGAGLGVAETGLTEYLLFLGEREISRLATLIEEHWETLKALSPLEEGDRKSRKKTAKAQVPKEIKEAMQGIFDGGRAVDLALFGRMLADRPEWNVDAASQVAHAISTHKVDREFDFYTAVDDLNPAEETGAGMMGDVEFVSACFYRYADLNLDLLFENLGQDRELAVKAARAFVEAFVKTLPSGKQNTFAAHNPPDFVAVRLSQADTPRNLANAFVPPVYVRPGEDLVAESIKRLEAYWERLDNAYGHPEGEKVFVLPVKDFELDYLAPHVRGNLEALLIQIESAVKECLGG